MPESLLTAAQVRAELRDGITKLIAARDENADTRRRLAANDEELKAGAKGLRQVAETAHSLGLITRDQHKAAIRVARGERVAWPEAN